MADNNRARFATVAKGEVLEIGPGYQPFCEVPDGRLTYVGRPVPGGRDVAFPELIGEFDGPELDHELDLDTDGLAGLDDDHYDAVIACHVVEHLVNPIAGLIEMTRVVRPGGHLVLVVPERTMTFDRRREPTPLAHVLDEYRSGVTELSVEHIREFVVMTEPTLDASTARAQMALTDAVIAAHRARSIHTHCWTGPEFAAAVTGLLALGLADWELTDLYLCDEDPTGEFGLVLRRPLTAPTPPERALKFVDDWCSRVAGDPARDGAVLAAFVRALDRDLVVLDDPDLIRQLVVRPTAHLVDRLAGFTDVVPRLRAENAALLERVASVEHQVRAYERSRAYRVGRMVTAPARLIRPSGV